MIIDFLERFQTGIVGLIGFTGVILTLFVNAWIARRHGRDARKHERETLGRALLAELSSHRQSIKRNIEAVTERAGNGTGALLVPAITNTPVFDASVARIGLLPGEQLGPVLEACLTLKEIDRSISLISAPDVSGHYRIIKGEYAPKAQPMLESLLPVLDAAIAALERATGCKYS